jgi:hypothetical protein
VRPPLVADLIVLVVTLRMLALSFCGMECALTMPLMVACAIVTLKLTSLPRPRAAQLASLGLLVALTALSRLDAILFGLGCAGLVFAQQRAAGVRRLALLGAGFSAGFAPFLAYLCWNWISQGALLTTSAEAKALAPGVLWNPHLFDQLSFGARLLGLYVPLTSAALLCSRWTPWRGPLRNVALLIFAFPVCLYTLLALRSDWLIWLWYFYPLPICMCVGLATLSEAMLTIRTASWVDRLPRRWALLLAVSVVGVAAYRSAHQAGRTNQGVMRAALKLDEFSRNHPGRYAMGDRAGLTALLVGQPLLQLEGLVADRGLLDLIRKQRSLSEVLATYRVDYLVEAMPTVELSAGRCQHLTEPKEAEAGARSPKLSGTFCNPLFRYDDVVDGRSTLVYGAGGSIEPPIATISD